MSKYLKQWEDEFDLKKTSGGWIEQRDGKGRRCFVKIVAVTLYDSNAEWEKDTRRLKKMALAVVPVSKKEYSVDCKILGGIILMWHCGKTCKKILESSITEVEEGELRE